MHRDASMAAQSRSLRNSLITLAVFTLLVAALLLAVPGLRSALEHLSKADEGLIALAILLELLSCAGYVAMFQLVFGDLGGRLTSRLSLAELAANSVVSLSGLAGIALGAWILRTKGVSAGQIARRSVVTFLLSSAVNFAAVILIGLAMWLGVLSGSRNELLTLLPAAAATVTAAAVLALPVWTRRVAMRGARFRRLRAALVALGDGVVETVRAIRSMDWRLLGAVAYWLFDNLVLYACLAAFGPAPSVWVVAMAYLVGMLANSVPVPGGLLAVEGGLVGMLLAFHVHPATLVIAAVLVYRAISLWVPAVIGSLAFVSLRREIARPVAPPMPG